MMSFLYSVGFMVEKAVAASEYWEIYCSPFGACGDGQSFIIDLAGRVIMVIFQVIGGAAVVAILWASNGLVMAGLDEAKRDEAKKIIQYALGGLVLAIMGWAIVRFVGTFIRSIAT